MRHCREELALDAIRLAQRGRFSGLPDEAFALRAKRLELAEKTGHEVGREHHDAHVECEARRVNDESVRVCSVCGDSEVGE